MSSVLRPATPGLHRHGTIQPAVMHMLPDDPPDGDSRASHAIRSQEEAAEAARTAIAS